LAAPRAGMAHDDGVEASDHKATRAIRSSAATASAVRSTSTSRSAPRRTALSCLPATVSTSLRSPDRTNAEASRRSSPLPSSASHATHLSARAAAPTLAKFGAIWYPRTHVNSTRGRADKIAVGWKDVGKDYVVYQLGAVASFARKDQRSSTEASRRVLHGVRGASGLGAGTVRSDRRAGTRHRPTARARQDRPDNWRRRAEARHQEHLRSRRRAERRRDRGRHPRAPGIGRGPDRRTS
jgi:hypothetical protein